MEDVSHWATLDWGSGAHELSLDNGFPPLFLGVREMAKPALLNYGLSSASHLASQLALSTALSSPYPLAAALPTLGATQYSHFPLHHPDPLGLRLRFRGDHRAAARS